MDDLDRQICELAHQLDGVQLRATLTTAAAMAAGLDNIAALALGNIVLASAGYPPTPVKGAAANRSLSCCNALGGPFAVLPGCLPFPLPQHAPCGL